MIIDTNAIYEAIGMYKEIGYEMVNVPMLVCPYADKATKPEQVLPKIHEGNGLHYVASAEQSFIHMLMKGQSLPNKAMALTPCVRLGEEDDTHTEVFMKLELFRLGEETFKITVDADCVLNDLLGGTAVAVGTKDGYDIENNGLEIGSYGVRRVQGCPVFTYGTGIAEPRFTLSKSYVRS